MKIIERIVQYPGRRRITKINEESNSDLIVDIVKAEGNVEIPGTELNKDTFELINGREDNSLSFTNLENEILPNAITGQTQLVTKSNGETWLIPPSTLGNNVQLGKNTGTTIKINDLEQMEMTFLSDPQTQITNNQASIESKLNINFVNFAEKTTLVNDDLLVIQNSQNYLNNKILWSAFKSQILNTAYPVGSIYMSVTSTNPSGLFGGVWQAWGGGRVPLAIGNNGETNYASTEITGGSENSLAAHSHSQNAHSHTLFPHRHSIRTSDSWSSNAVGAIGRAAAKAVAFVEQSGGNFNYVLNNGNSEKIMSQEVNDSNVSITNTQSTTATNNMAGTVGGNRMPFITCYMWKRIS